MREEHIELLHSEPAGPPVVIALDRLIDKDRLLFEIDVNERSITHRLALYLQGAFPGWHVDCGYNRDEFETKELELPELKPDRQDSKGKKWGTGKLYSSWNRKLERSLISVRGFTR